ncbi:hypothetical protein LshimejAT787_1202780 [Lyophyllum shimeji]|uniref:Uncharacterized protein n=1 Tax=Lyophyllum shimeji TaxID=47721 RepID=A0A9P3PWF3_LYOSH|nr:hypothetical protein LshimejAT787_1202780 [Lyophyllum shimeji]
MTPATCTKDSTFPPLPHDVQRLILECSAYHDRSMALKLVGLSRKVQTWIDPILYRHVTLEYPYQAEAFVRTLETSNKRHSFLATQVKILCFAYGIALRDAVKILSVCKRVTSLASWLELSQLTDDFTHSDLESFSKLLTNGTLELHRLSMILHDFLCVPDPDFTIPIFRHVTHLDIYQGSDHFGDWSWTGFRDLSNLTHLSFDISLSTPLEIVHEVLPHAPPNLRLCLVLLSTRNSTLSIKQFCSGNELLESIAEGKVDPRLVIGTNEPLEEECRYGGLVIVHLYDDVSETSSRKGESRRTLDLTTEFRACVPAGCSRTRRLAGPWVKV